MARIESRSVMKASRRRRALQLGQHRTSMRYTRRSSSAQAYLGLGFGRSFLGVECSVHGLGAKPDEGRRSGAGAAW